MSLRCRVALLTAAVASVVPALAAAPAGAQTTAGATAGATSSNWSGYSVTGASFKRVTAAWKVPTVDCSTGSGYTANWVGLGGNSDTSDALEQTGTESDCSASGKATYTAWWEVVPDVAHTAKLKVTAGDKLAASVEVAGKQVTMRLTNKTRGTSFKQVYKASAVDVSSAEWILEAPAACSSADTTSCSVLPLADFGSTAFSSASAVTKGGHAGTISDRHWTPTAITLNTSSSERRGPQTVAAGLGGAAAIPGALTGTGSGFAITYGQATTTVVTDPYGGPGGGRWHLGRGAR